MTDAEQSAEKIYNRVKRYEKALEILMDDSVFKAKLDNLTKVEYTVEERVENSGVTTKYINSVLGEATVLDIGKDLTELDRDEYSAIKYQDEFRKYKKIKRYVKKSSILYGISCTVGGILSVFI